MLTPPEFELYTCSNTGGHKGSKLALLHSEPYSVIFSFTGTLSYVARNVPKCV
jgi:hypothetical protein